MAAVPSAPLPAEASLATLRRGIDSVDDRIHDLLMQRATLSVEVAKAKARGGGAGAPVFRPAREAEILRRLVARNQGPLPPALIVRLWREIMVASSRLQGPLAVAVAPGQGGETARGHFGAAVLRPLSSPAAVVAAVARRRAQLGVLPLPGAGETGRWWQRLPAGVRILARLPFARAAAREKAEAVVVGLQPFEASSDDAFFVAVAWARGGRRPAIPSARVLATARRAGRLVSLLETDTPFDELCTRLGAAGTAELLGGYARPLVLRSASRK